MSNLLWVLANCGHTACIKCSNNEIQCISCSHISRSQNVTINLALINMMERNKSISKALNHHLLSTCSSSSLFVSKKSKIEEKDESDSEKESLSASALSSCVFKNKKKNKVKVNQGLTDSDFEFRSESSTSSAPSSPKSSSFVCKKRKNCIEETGKDNWELRSESLSNNSAQSAFYHHIHKNKEKTTKASFN